MKIENTHTRTAAKIEQTTRLSEQVGAAMNDLEEKHRRLVNDIASLRAAIRGWQ
jgi:hypothetical protein